MSLFSSFAADSSRWEAWLDAHGEVFYLYARQQTRSEADAKDVFQQALFESWRKCSGKVPDKAVVLATIRRRAIDLGRCIDRRSVRETRVAEEGGYWYTTDFSEGDTRHFLSQAIATLPDDLREVLVLRIWGDLTFPAIAQLAQIPVATATSRYRYALERLRGAIAELQP